MTKVIVDPGSCHFGSKETAKELIACAAEKGADAIKFQLFKNLPPNIELPYEWFPELVDYGVGKNIEVFASVWDNKGMVLCNKAGCGSIKFAHSQRNSSLIPSALGMFQNVFISYSTLGGNAEKNVNRLYCVPEYPVLHHIDFEGLFDQGRFQGFSDHTLGTTQAVTAAEHGAEYIEKHFWLGGKKKCEDSKFAILPDQLEKMCVDIYRTNHPQWMNFGQPPNQRGQQ